MPGHTSDQIAHMETGRLSARYPSEGSVSDVFPRIPSLAQHKVDFASPGLSGPDRPFVAHPVSVFRERPAYLRNDWFAAPVSSSFPGRTAPQRWQRDKTLTQLKRED